MKSNFIFTPSENLSTLFRSLMRRKARYKKNRTDFIVFSQEKIQIGLCYRSRETSSLEKQC